MRFRFVAVLVCGFGFFAAVPAQAVDIFGVEVDLPGASAGVAAEVPAVEARGPVAAQIAARARALNVPVYLALAVGRFESGFDMHKTGSSGERGAMQILPATAHSVGVYGNLYGAAGIEAGVRYLRRCLDTQGRYGLAVALSAYNHGWGKVYASSYGYKVLALAKGRPVHKLRHVSFRHYHRMHKRHWSATHHRSHRHRRA